MRSLAIVCAVAFAGTMAAAQRFEFFPGGIYDSKVPTPESVLGYPIGSYHTSYAGLERWLDAIRGSDRVRIVRYGESVEKRPLYLIIISSPANIARLDAVRAAMAKLADPRTSSDAEAETIATTMPAVAWMNHANDGNESAAFESAIQTSYQLAAGTDETTKLVLDRLVTIVNPAHNPESHERFVAWYNAVQVGRDGTADPQAAEHHAPWGMSTNNNHYQIDLNRDAFFVSQQETAAIVKAFGEWNPVLFIDHHGQTKNMFFPPPAEAVNLNVTKNQTDWMERYGNAIGDAFDRQGWSYYRRGRFDLLLRRFLGFLADAQRRGRTDVRDRRRRLEGPRLGARGRHHPHVARRRRPPSHGDDGVAAVDGREQGPAAARLLPVQEVGNRRRQNGCHEAGRPASRQRRSAGGAARVDPAGAAHRSQSGLQAVPRREGARLLRRAGCARDVPSGAYVISMAQPQKRLAKALLEIEPGFKDAFLKEEERKKRRAELVGQRPRDGFYDTTAWSLPLLFGVDAIWGRRRGTGGDSPHRVRSGTGPSQEASGPPRYGYAFRGDTFAAMRLTAQLLKDRSNVAVATEPFTLKSAEFPRGTMIARSERNTEALHARLSELAKEARVELVRLDSARVDRGSDLGEDPIVELRHPRIAVVTDDPTDDRSYGATWFTLEQRLGLPFTALRTIRSATPTWAATTSSFSPRLALRLPGHPRRARNLEAAALDAGRRHDRPAQGGRRVRHAEGRRVDRRHAEAPRGDDTVVLRGEREDRAGLHGTGTEKR